jgi:LacI family transcriptional regulator
VRERYDAFMDVTRELGQPSVEKSVRRFPCGVQDFEALTQLVEDALFAVLHQPQPPTAIFSMNGMILSSLFEACDRRGIRVPEDLEIISFHDGPFLPPYLVARIDQILQQPHRIGQVAAERLIQRLHGDTSPPQIVRVPAELQPARFTETTN